MTKNIIVTAVVALVVSVVVGLFLGGQPSQSNIAENVQGLSETVTKTARLIVGQNGTTSGSALTFVKAGTCTFRSDSSIAATSTGTGTCAVTGVRTGDLVQLRLATTTTKFAAQYVVIDAVPSTDVITARVFNLTGTAAIPGATSGFGSSTQYLVLRASN